MGTHPIFESDFDCLTEENNMDDQGLFKVARYRPNESNEIDDDDHASKKRKKKPKVNAMLERARLRAAKRKSTPIENPAKSADSDQIEDSVDDSVKSDESSSSEMEEEVEKKVEKVEEQHFQILDDVADRSNKKIKLTLPRWCREPITIEQDEPKLKEVAGILPEVIYRNLKRQIKRLFPVQACLIRQLMARGPRRDLAVQAPTGSGKTLAFLVPALSSIVKRAIPAIRILIVAPTRVLATQIFGVCTDLMLDTNLRARLVIGADGAGLEEERIKIGEHVISNIDVVVATPGKLVHYMDKLDLSRLHYLIIDEADQMEGTWLKQLESVVPSNARKLLFSATLATDPQFLAALKLKAPILYSTNQSAAHPAGLSEEKIEVELRLKPFALRVLIDSYKRVLIFANSTETAERLYTLLKGLGVKLELLSSSLNHDWKRNSALKKLKKGELHALVCTDVGARGLDIDDCDLVVNYDLAPLTQNHIHRSGRTARAGNGGKCVTLVDRNGKTYDQMMRQIGRRWTRRVLTGEELERAKSLK